MPEPTYTTEIVSEATKTIEASGGIGVLGINLKIFIAQLFNFTVVLLVLWKWVYTPLVRLLDERSEKIEKSMEHAAEIEKRMQAIEADHDRIISEAKSESAHMLEQARTDAEKRKKELLEATKLEVQKIVTQGKEQLQAEKVNMLRDAKTEIVDLAIAAATNVLKESVSEKTSQKLAQDVVNRMV